MNFLIHAPWHGCCYLFWSCICVSAVQTHTHIHCIWSHVLSIHWYKAEEKSWTYCTHISPDNTQTLWPHMRVHFNPTVSPIDWNHHSHRSERIPVRADRIENVSLRDMQQEREAASDSIHSHMKRKWREESLILSAVAVTVKKRMVHWVQAYQRSWAGWESNLTEKKEKSGGFVRMEILTLTLTLTSYYLPYSTLNYAEYSIYAFFVNVDPHHQMHYSSCCFQIKTNYNNVNLIILVVQKAEILLSKAQDDVLQCPQPKDTSFSHRGIKKRNEHSLSLIHSFSKTCVCRWSLMADAVFLLTHSHSVL